MIWISRQCWFSNSCMRYCGNCCNGKVKHPTLDVSCKELYARFCMRGTGQHGPDDLTTLFRPGRSFDLDDGNVYAYRSLMEWFCSSSSRRAFFVATLAMILTLAPALHGNASATHPDRFTAQGHHAYADVQQADCCTDDQNSEHSVQAACNNCIMVCMAALQALVSTQLAMPFSVSAAYLLPAALVKGSLAAVPDLRPPKT